MNLLLTGILLLMTMLSKAQNYDSLQFPAKWDLQTCLGFALKNNIQLNTIRLSKKVSEQELLLAKAARYPNLLGSISQTLTHSTNANPVIGGFATQSSFSSSYGVNSSWVVFNGGYINLNIRLQHMNLASAGLNVEELENSLTIEITQDFLNVLLARENIVYVEDLLKTSLAQLEQGKAEYNAGSIARNALTVLEAQSATDQYNLVAAQSAYRQNVLSLKQLLQLPSGYQMNIAMPDTLIATAIVSPLEDVQAAALQTRPEVRNAQLGVQMAQTDLKMARAQTWPVASIGAGLATGYSNNESVDYLKQLDNNFYQRLGLTISIPIFNNRIYKTQVETSRIAVDQAKLSLLGTQTTLSQQVEQAYISVLNAQAQYDASVIQLRANQESYRVASEQFKVGASNTVELLQQKNLYIQALQGYLEAKYAAALNIQIYNFYKGIPVKL
ncbi:MAG TPA: TolC family protein [Puia sp.]|nr:TolC family protein [Puia sp.]